MKRLTCPSLIAFLVICGDSSAHHGDDFILLEDYSMPAVWRPQVTSTLDWEKFGSIDTLQTEPTLYFTPMPRIGFSLAARFADESGDWALSSVTPRIHVQLTDPKSKFPIRVGFSIGYQFGIDIGDDDHHAQGSGSASHSHDADHQHGASSKTKNGKTTTQPEHDHSDHSHEVTDPNTGVPAPAEHNHDDGSHTHAAPVVPVTAADPSAAATTAPVTAAPVTTVPTDPTVPHDHSTHDHGPTTPCDPNVDVDCEGVPLPPPAMPVNESAQTQSTGTPPSTSTPVSSNSSTATPAAPPAESAPSASAPSNPASEATPSTAPAQDDPPAQQQTGDHTKKSKTTKSKPEKKKTKKTIAKAPNSGAHAHSHNQNQWIGRLVVEANFGSTKILANLIGVSPEDGSPSWGYAAGVRHQFTHKLALGVEAIGDFVDHGQHEIILGGYMTPVHSLTFKIGAGFGLTETSPDFALRSGFVVRF